MRNVTILLAVAAMLALAAPASGYNYFYWQVAGTGDWDTEGNWDLAGYPTTTSDYAYIENGGIVEIDHTITGGAYCRFLYVGTATGDGAIEISADALDVYSYTYIASGDDATGKITQTGGTVTLSNLLYVAYNTTGTGTYEISAGTFSAPRMWMTPSAGGSATFKVIGDDATVSIGDSGLILNDRSTLAFEVDSDGISAFDLDAALALDGILTVTDDNAAVGVYTLMTYNSKSAAEFDTVNKPANGLWNDPVYGDTSLTIEKVPEPATLALLGIGGIGVLLRRRRK